MSHSLAPHRDAINALIGPLEEIKANLDTLIANIKDSDSGWSASANFLHYIRIDDAINELSNTVTEIDEWIDDPEDETPETPEDDDPDPDEDEEDDDNPDDE